MDSLELPSPPVFLSVSGLYDVEFRILLTCRCCFCPLAGCASPAIYAMGFKTIDFPTHHCTVLHCTALYSSVMHRTVLYCTGVELSAF